MKPRVLIVDNLDSFTANLAHACAQAGAEVEVIRDLPAGQGRETPTHVVLSPGPGTPFDATASARAYATYAGVVPLLGVCLGHQWIAAAHGWEVVRSVRPTHGKATRVRHAGGGLFAGLPSPFPAARYHSLAVVEPPRPSALVVDAATDDDARIVMGVRHRVDPIFGVQFHPESFLTEHGVLLLRTFLTT